MKAAPKVKFNWCEHSHPADSCVDKNCIITKCPTKHKPYCKLKGMCKFLKKENVNIFTKQVLMVNILQETTDQITKLSFWRAK